MSAHATAIRKALEKHVAGLNQYASVTAEDVVRVAREVREPDEVTAALLAGASAVGPGKTVHQKVDDLIHLLDKSGVKAEVTVAPLAVDPTPRPPAREEAEPKPAADPPKPGKATKPQQ
jgi:non-ribosomal peptide synthetase component F